jgi:L-ascorbate metabolism protein UlaG (beta-lactamase superfamily)
VNKLKKRFSSCSRRKFLTVGSLGLAGVWAGYSDQMGARALRGLVAETRRSVLTPSYTPSPVEWNPNRLTAAWLGHSTVLINFFGLTILTDPVLYKRVGADTFFGTIGAKRLVAPALKPSQLPEIDLVLLSHAHMDHFDFATLRALKGERKVVSARGTLDLLQRTTLNNPVTLGWGEKATVVTGKDEAEIHAFEVRHWGARWRVDRHRGYNGYVIKRNGRQIIFGGDTAQADSFRGLHCRQGYDLAIMPIGAYQPFINSHCSPEQAVDMANDANAGFFLPIHFKTFPLGREGSVEPMERLSDAIEEQRIALRDVGETFVLS